MNNFVSEMIKQFFDTLKRLKNWEIRERKKSRDYSKDMEREDERRRETVNTNHNRCRSQTSSRRRFADVRVCVCPQLKEAKRLKEFLEDYDDDRDDPKYYRSVLQWTLKSVRLLLLLLGVV